MIQQKINYVKLMFFQNHSVFLMLDAHNFNPIMKKVSLFLLALSFIGLQSCQNSNPTETTDDEGSEEMVVEEVIEGPALDLEAEVAKIDALREEIEAWSKANAGEEISTENMRAKVKQKWSKIHVYRNAAGEVVRIKTYPYAEISARTEEFYFQGGNLVLAAVEDNGLAEGEENFDKLYYYKDGEPIHEVKGNDEPEYSIKESDAEELMQEANEYLKMI